MSERIADLIRHINAGRRQGLDVSWHRAELARCLALEWQKGGKRA